MSARYKIKKGLNINLIGEAELLVKDHKINTIALCPEDFRWMKPELKVCVGDKVRIGTPIITFKDYPEIKIVSPISGEVEDIVRGEKRKIEGVIIKSDGEFEAENFDLDFSLERKAIINTLLTTGLWSLIKQRPFDSIANPNDTPKAIFVSCFDSAPLAPSYPFILQNRQEEFQKGVEVLSHLANTPIFLGLKADIDNSFFEATENVGFRYFEGPHPVGNIGTQIHHISPIAKGECAWHINPQDIACIGRLYLQKKLDFSKIVAICGSSVEDAFYLKTICGSDVSGAICASSKSDGKPNLRVISGNVLSGANVTSSPFLRYYHNQVTVIPEGGERKLLGWLNPGFRRWSFSHAYLSWLFPRRKYDFDTTLNGGKRTMVVSDVYEKVFPFDILPMELLRACEIEDIELMEQLGIYEVVEEDFALCDLVCPSKTECQQIIYKGLSLLKE